MTTQPGSGHDLVHASHVRLAYRAMLGRFPTEEEVRTQLAGVRSTGELLDVISSAPEFTGERHVALDPEPAPAVINLWSPEHEAWTLPVGTVSPDGTTVVGNEGWLYPIEQQGEFPEVAADRWASLLAFRAEDARRAGAELVSLVVPDRLAVLDAKTARPATPLLDRLGDQLLYPLDALTACGRAFLRTDLQCTLEGNAAVAAATLAALGADPLPDELLEGAPTYLISGDLGRRFSPPVVELVQTVGSFGGAAIIEDNREAVAGAGGRIGSRRVLRNAGATDDRTAVIFGDLAGFPDVGSERLAWFLAQRFAEVHFVWAPFGWDPDYVQRHGATVVVSQASEGLLAHLPARTVDTDALTSLAAGSGRPVELSAVLDPDA